MKRCGSLTWTLAALALAASGAWAQESSGPGPGREAASSAPAATQPATSPAEAGAPRKAEGGPSAAAPGDAVGRSLGIIGCCIAAAFAAAYGGMAIARIAIACLESIARQPEASGSLFGPMIITAAMVEGCILFAIVIALLGILK
jgi:F-type H+-transporting ATPase subunit c